MKTMPPTALYTPKSSIPKYSRTRRDVNNDRTSAIKDLAYKAIVFLTISFVFGIIQIKYKYELGQ